MDSITQSIQETRVFVAGATGAIGRRLCPLLVAAGYTVYGTTRSPARALLLEQQGVRPLVVDVYDASKLAAAVQEAAPHVVIHQLTDLPPGLDPARMHQGRLDNARIRHEGTRNLVAAIASFISPSNPSNSASSNDTANPSDNANYNSNHNSNGITLIAQSIAFGYAASGNSTQLELTEEAPLASPALHAFEQQVLNAPVQTAIVLRYGILYGPGSGFDLPTGNSCAIHVDAAADAAMRAITAGQSGIYNITDDNGAVSNAKAKSLLLWNPDIRFP
ncbi:hypothetical protein HK100_000185 [Physocladia obscura]|uniref:NAD-dependent epimerase/dehydratase domain-containing protein n=1 Tax=Physocladia obscura TaxID=109957 RepID=A0AAD5XCP9_9FUNG|nr:hypothetical protein HK100_000185 [Physocladia obscura]